MNNLFFLENIKEQGNNVLQIAYRSFENLVCSVFESFDDNFDSVNIGQQDTSNEPFCGKFV